jgi:NAD(P)-dependent dehydrogenase (short-subunit alcohol dehydrogenase family)
MTASPVIIVTGASRGLGAAISRWLMQSGARLVLAARSSAPIAALAEESPHDALAVTTDVSDPEACRALVETAMERFDRLDALVNNAAVVEPLGLLETADIDQWRNTLQVNLLGPAALARFALEELRRRRGRVVNISSGAAVHAITAAGAYCVSKAALNHLTTVIAAEAPEVTAVALRPGVVDTRMQVVLRQQPLAEQAEFYRDLQRRRQLEPPMVPARTAAWLALAAPPALSGRFFSYDDPEISEPALNALGTVADTDSTGGR